MEFKTDGLSVQSEFTNEEIKNLIYTIRGKQVMLDSDVAMLYNTETRKINQTVKRNVERFPEDFCFKLNVNEMEEMRSQFVIASKKIDKYRNIRYQPYVFTEQGIAMLSALLKSEIAIKVSVNIMKAFIEMRKFVSLNGKVFERLNSMEYKLLEHDKKFDKVFNQLQKEEGIKQKYFSRVRFMMHIA